MGFVFASPITIMPFCGLDSNRLNFAKILCLPCMNLKSNECCLHQREFPSQVPSSSQICTRADAGILTKDWEKTQQHCPYIQLVDEDLWMRHDATPCILGAFPIMIGHLFWMVVGTSLLWTYQCSEVTNYPGSCWWFAGPSGQIPSLPTLSYVPAESFWALLVFKLFFSLFMWLVDRVYQLYEDAIVSAMSELS